MLGATGSCLLAMTTAIFGQASSPADPDLRDGKVAFPASYKEWVFLSAGLGMAYGPNAPADGAPKSFTNVYVNPAAYRAFLASGRWPDRTMFVLEIRKSASQGSINKAGFYQTDLIAVEGNVKDARLPGGWGFFDFGREQTAKAPLPQSADCYACHAANTAVEHTFVQFYPELMAVARMFGNRQTGLPRAAALATRGATAAAFDGRCIRRQFEPSRKSPARPVLHV
jgi:hypothetical protein